MRILVVEDEPKAAAFLKKGLSEEGFVVDVFHDGMLAETTLQTQRYDLAILDINLPGKDGFQIGWEARRRSPGLPIIMLTARDAIADRVRGIEGGANVYLLKPFSFSELLAYVRSLTAPQQLQSSHLLKAGSIEMDLQRQTVRRNGRSVDLTSKEFCLLSLFIRRKGHVLSRTVLAEEVWGFNFDPGTNVIDVHIRRLRSKIEAPDHPKTIRTVRGVGYVFDETPE